MRIDGIDAGAFAMCTTSDGWIDAICNGRHADRCGYTKVCANYPTAIGSDSDWIQSIATLWNAIRLALSDSKCQTSIWIDWIDAICGWLLLDAHVTFYSIRNFRVGRFGALK